MRRARSLCGAAGAAVLAATMSVGVAAPARADVAVPVADVRSQEWWLNALKIQQAWPLAKRGAGVTVGVLDSGVDVTHPDLRGVVTGGKDFAAGSTGNGTRPVVDVDTNEPNYHGTEMAGYIAGRGQGSGNAQGLIGVAPAAKVLSASFVVATEGNDERVGRAIRWLTDNGAKVINMSFGGLEIPDADLAYAESKDVVLVAAVGNDKSTPARPANRMGVVGVAGVVKNLATWPYGNRGGPVIAGGPSLPPSDSGGGVALSGPAADAPTEEDADGMVGLSNSGTGYERLLGTSNAAAVVTGVVALIRAAHPELNAANVINRLGRTARHVGRSSAYYTEAQGFGVVNAYAAITDDIPETCENPFGSLASPQSFGLWKNIANYKPACQNRPSTSPSSSAPSSGSSSSPGQAIPPASSDSSSGVPVWVWPVVAVVVLAVIGGVVLARRSRRPVA